MILFAFLIAFYLLGSLGTWAFLREFLKGRAFLAALSIFWGIVFPLIGFLALLGFIWRARPQGGPRA